MTVCPYGKQGRQQPQTAAEFENGHRHREQQPGEKIRTVQREPLRHAGGRQCGGDRSVNAAAPAERNQPGECAKRGQRDRPGRHDRRASAHLPDGVEDHLRQPLVRQVEPARPRFSRINVMRRGGGPRKRVGEGKCVLLHDVLAGAQVPPEIGIVHFSREEPEQQNCRQCQQQRAQSARSTLAWEAAKWTVRSVPASLPD